MRKKEYPKWLQAECANPFCRVKASRLVEIPFHRFSLWFCSPACKKHRRWLADRGMLEEKEKKVNRPKKKREKTSEQKAAESRAKARVYPDPTPYERKLWGWDR